MARLGANLGALRQVKVLSDDGLGLGRGPRIDYPRHRVPSAGQRDVDDHAVFEGAVCYQCL